ncbi:hypothetical protein RchiOBHm_Chr5g0027781 [Rosa chinensis]|uniref:Uncharacterized protein n=1 Tax=Rosa chinensis TaxID=74649 RepID=A0A2P6Q974_ROSCH|nr:hypothetical protein RchiOBHm_Chr5g0027781 [Rosa chinensis]
MEVGGIRSYCYGCRIWIWFGDGNALVVMVREGDLVAILIWWPIRASLDMNTSWWLWLEWEAPESRMGWVGDVGGGALAVVGQQRQWWRQR